MRISDYTADEMLILRI